MMRKVAVTAVLLLTMGSASAELIKVDLSETGSLGVTLDSDTGLEWLGLRSTLGMSMNEALTAFSGWRLATEFEVNTVVDKVRQGERYSSYFGSAFQQDISLYNSSNSGNSYFVQYAGKLFNTFQGGNTAPYQSGVSMRVGSGLHLSDTTGGLLLTGGNSFSDSNGTYIRYNDITSSNLSDVKDYKGAQMSVFLVSDGGQSFASLQDPTLNINNPNAPINNATAVSEPGASAILGLGLMGLAVRRKRMNEFNG